MAMNFNELLPIGTVVLLNNAQKRLVVIGVGQTDESSGTEYDYMGVFYPEGNMGDGTHFLFNHSDVDQIFFRGYEDEERERFIAALQDFYERQS